MSEKKTEPKFRVGIVARIKHGDLWEAIRKRGWNQRQGAEFLGMDQSRFGRLLNLGNVPKQLNEEQERKLLELTGKLPEELWPPEIFTEDFLEAPKVLEVMREVTPRMLAERGILALPTGQDEILEDIEQGEIVEGMLAGLSQNFPKEAAAIRAVILEGKTQTQVAQEMGVTNSCIWERIQRGLKELRLRGKRERGGKLVEFYWRARSYVGYHSSALPLTELRHARRVPPKPRAE